MEDSSTLTAFPDNSSLDLSLAYDLLDLVASPSLESPIGSKLRRSTWVRIPSPYLSDYHRSFAFTILYEPHIYREAHINPLW